MPPRPPLRSRGAIKPLEWVDTVDETGRYATAKTRVGGYEVFECTITTTKWTRTVTGWSGHWVNADQRTTTYEEAKAAAQADYETRIRSALADQPVDVDALLSEMDTLWRMFVVQCESIEDRVDPAVGKGSREEGFYAGEKYAAKSIRRSVSPPKYNKTDFPAYAAAIRALKGGA